jgi:hypothetical protein
MALANVVIATLIWFQLDVLRGQLNEMKGSSGQMNDALSAARDSASAARDSAAAGSALVKEAASSAAAAEALVREAAATNKALLRARLMASPGDWKFLTTQDFARWEIAVHIKNVGKTPAVQVNWYGGLAIFQYPLPLRSAIDLLDPSKDTDTGAKLTIQPDADRQTFSHFMYKAQLKQLKRLNDLKNDNIRLYVIGYIRYSDIYTDQHITKYCISYPYETIIALKETKTLVGESCLEYNDAD